MKLVRKRIGDLGHVVTGKTPPTKTQSFFGGDYLFVTPSDLVFDHYFCRRTETTLTELSRERFPNQFIPAGSVMFTCIGNTIGKCAIASDWCLTNQQINSIVEDGRCDSRYLYYLLCAQAGRIRGLASGAATPIINKTDFANVEVVVHDDPKAQRRIADVLSAYDELIETNRRRMGLLEEAARVLYREWFVRLRHPASAKATAGQPGHPRTGLPAGWQRKPLSALSGFLNRGIAPHYDDTAEGLVLNQKCIRNQQLDLGPARHQSREVSEAKRVRRHDILINSTGEGTLGRVAQVHTEIPNCTVDSHVTIVRPSEEIGPHYLGLAVMAFEPMLMTAGRGATNQTELARDTIGELPILVPDRETVRRFEEHAEPIFTQVLTLQNQNRQLRAARDLLLPKLMSGRIAV